MKTTIALILTVLVSYISGCSQTASSNDRMVDRNCEDCELMYQGMPTTLTSVTKIAGPDEPGEPMVITGTIFKQDGKTPAAGVVLYVYHTDKAGKYTPLPKQVDGKRHGHLRGWIKTGADGKYKFTSIRPASYPNSDAPQHIHPIIKEPGVSHYWISEYLFDDDPNLTEEVKSKEEKRGGEGIIHLSKDAQGVWIGKRDIILGMNVPNY
jgi:protocatechuate 3,4-dioxygenase, beta subunit